jgi:hypothetical protein
MRYIDDFSPFLVLDFHFGSMAGGPSPLIHILDDHSLFSIYFRIVVSHEREADAH